MEQSTKLGVPTPEKRTEIISQLAGNHRDQLKAHRVAVHELNDAILQSTMDEDLKAHMMHFTEPLLVSCETLHEFFATFNSRINDLLRYEDGEFQKEARSENRPTTGNTMVRYKSQCEPPGVFPDHHKSIGKPPPAKQKGYYSDWDDH